MSVPAVGGEPTTLVSDLYIRDLAFADGYLFWANFDTLFQGDPFTGEVAVSVDIGFEPNALVIANQYAYVHHSYGQARYHHPSGDFAVFFPGKDFYETPLVANASGVIWSRGGIFYLRPHGSDQVQTLFTLDKGRRVTALHADAGGFLWADDQKGVFRHDLALKATVRVTDTTFMSAYVAITSDVNTIYLMTATGDIAAVPRAGIN